jgi:hypothetical protein
MDFRTTIQMSNQEDFIKLYHGVYPKGYCEHLIAEFERLTQSGAGTNRQKGEGAPRHSKDDLQLALNMGVHTVAPFEDKPTVNMFFDGLQRCYEDYVERFSVLGQGRIRSTHMKMQRTDPGGGYHVWHAEQGNGGNADRVLVYMLYLNSLGDGNGGETEFLYQRCRIAPQANTMLLWPATFTHAHRGNPVLCDQSKYIVTGWFYYE